jgi:hypothetical protein
MVIRYVTNGGGAGTLLDGKALFNPDTYETKNVLVASAVLCASFLGFDAVTTLAEETKNPEKVMGKAIIGVVVHPYGRVQRGDIGVLHAGLGFDLAEKAVSQLRLSRKIREQHLHGLDAVRNDIPDLIDLPHAAGAENADNLIVADVRADLEVHH